jgi:hypothetical protein
MLNPGSASADVWSDIAGILTDPFKLGQGGESIYDASQNIREAVERAAMHAERLQGEFDKDTREYIFQMDQIVARSSYEIEKSTDRVDEIVKETLTEIGELEQTFMANAETLVLCGTERSAYQVQERIAEVLDSLGERRPTVTIGRREILSVKIEADDIPSPIEGYEQARDLLEAELAALKPNDPPSKITDIYAEILRLSEITRCHYHEETNTYQRLYIAELEYLRLDRVWRGRTFEF